MLNASMMPLLSVSKLTGEGNITNSFIPFIHWELFFDTLVCIVATPEPGLTRLADSDRNTGDARPKPLIKSIYQIHFINISIFILKSLRKKFQFGASPKHLQIQCNFFTKYAFIQNVAFYAVYNIISKIIFIYRYKII